MFEPRKTSFRVAAEYQPLLRMIGLDAEGVFADPRIVAWRRLSDRENCTLDADVGDAWRSPKVRLHVKRYFPVRGVPPAEEEVHGHRALSIEKIPTAPLVGWGVLADGRSFTLFEDLAGYRPADKLIESGTPFAGLLGPTADLAAALHWAGLHHRDLYLCHFMARLAADGGEGSVDLRLIDTARAPAAGLPDAPALDCEGPGSVLVQHDETAGDSGAATRLAGGATPIGETFPRTRPSGFSDPSSASRDRSPGTTGA